ncbi:MAG TPA: 3-dehydroquinate synthase [Phaeodactylibacter sp.]|nr:3-dehydroquinate synthase [Phaeodactylibacter sp.]
MQILQLHTYSIFIGNIWDEFNLFLEQENYSQVFVLVDKNTNELCLPIFLKNIKYENCKIIVVPAGETFKTLSTCQHIWSELMRMNADRKALMINLGGGVIGDMGGFCASTFKRGIDFIQIPTTLLSQVDSSIGGKLGIDFEKVKNSIGLFKNPQAVFIDTVFLKTLPIEEIRSGWAEMLKHGLIANASHWEHLLKIEHLENASWNDYVTSSLQVKKYIVEEDPFERNVRKTLNFGHTIGHAVETFFLETPTSLRHGEAIVIGIMCEAYLSFKKVGFPKEELNRVFDFFKKKYPQVHLPEEKFPELIASMRKDKKNENNTINFTLLTQVGVAEINQTCTEDEIMESLRFYNKMVTTMNDE